MKDYILTYMGIKFFPLRPNIEDINIEDIAHSLSYMTRANGHLHVFYSVGQHSIYCAKEAKARGYDEQVQLGCLLHDASESYLSDITRPIKQHFHEYDLFEKKLQSLIYQKYGLGQLSSGELDQIKEIDDTLLYYEFLILKDYQVFSKRPKMVLDFQYENQSFDQVKNEFLLLFNQLRGES